MFGHLRGALQGRKIAFDRDSFTAAVEGRIVVTAKRSASLDHVITTSTVPADALEGEPRRGWPRIPRAVPPTRGVKGAIEVTWDARVPRRERTVELKGESRVACRDRGQSSVRDARCSSPHRTDLFVQTVAPIRCGSEQGADA